MKSKTLTIIFGMILLIGIVSAEPILSNVDETINLPIEIIAGNTFEGDFSFDYLSIADNEDNSPLIIRLDLTSDDQINYPVWKDDFEIDGYVDKCTWTILGVCVLPSTVPFDCSEDAPLTIEHAIGIETINNIPDGTFYCYNEEADLKLDEHDKVVLNIKSNPALYPGTYNLIATLHYLSDTYAPIVNIINKASFEDYYRELDNIEVKVEINDINLESYWTIIFTDENIVVPFSHNIGDVYYFTRNLPVDIQEGDYELTVTAKDKAEFVGSDTTTLMIDRTGPIIEAIQPNGSIYTEIIPIELGVTDVKAGVNTEEVYYRLREMDGSSICPEAGIGTWDCYNSGWMPIDLTNGNSISGNYTDSFDTSSLGSGEYWFEAKAEDLLGNIGILE